MTFLKDPLFHFLLLGVALFVLFAWVAGDARTEIDRAEEIVVTEGRIRALSQSFSQVWQRAPSEQELDGLIQDHIREEILYREALAMGLDRDDTIVRRRMRQKIEFLSEDIARLDEPSDEDLEAFLAADPQRFRKDTRFSFRQVYVSTDKHGASAEAEALSLLAELRGRDRDISGLGDRLMIEHRFEDTPERDIARSLGSQFLEALVDCPVGSWQGPIVSGFGLHLVHISEHIDGRVPGLVEVREAVVREWIAKERKKANEAFYEMLRERYTVTIVGSATASSSQDAATEMEK